MWEEKASGIRRQASGEAVVSLHSTFDPEEGVGWRTDVAEVGSGFFYLTPDA